MGGTIGEGRENELETELNKGALWAVTYGDLMSYLMIFFLVLFSMFVGKKNSGRSLETSAQLADVQKAFGGKIDPSLRERIAQFKNEEALAGKLKESAEAQALKDFVQIETGEDEVRLVLPEAITFEPGRAAVGESARALIRVLGRLAKNLPNELIVEGHTDNRPIHTKEFPDNFFLSCARARGVMDILSAEGVAPSRLAGHGYGEFHPVTSNDTETGRAKNRRVEIVLVRRR